MKQENGADQTSPELLYESLHVCWLSKSFKDMFQ